MGIKRYYATKDNTISNAFKSDLRTRATGSNMGAADILETFVIHGQTSASIDAANAEQSRIIIQFPIDSIQSEYDIIKSSFINGSAQNKEYTIFVLSKSLFVICLIFLFFKCVLSVSFLYPSTIIMLSMPHPFNVSKV